MVKTFEDIDTCSADIDRLEKLGIPNTTIRNLRIWLNKETRRLLKSGQKRT